MTEHDVEGLSILLDLFLKITGVGCLIFAILKRDWMFVPLGLAIIWISKD